MVSRLDPGALPRGDPFRQLADAGGFQHHPDCGGNVRIHSLYPGPLLGQPGVGFGSVVAESTGFTTVHCSYGGNFDPDDARHGEIHFWRTALSSVPDMVGSRRGSFAGGHWTMAIFAAVLTESRGQSIGRRRLLDSKIGRVASMLLVGSKRSSTPHQPGHICRSYWAMEWSNRSCQPL
jgi:hypothetical protein